MEARFSQIQLQLMKWLASTNLMEMVLRDRRFALNPVTINEMVGKYQLDEDGTYQFTRDRRFAFLSLRPARAWFLEITLVRMSVCVFVCVCVCVRVRPEAMNN